MKIIKLFTLSAILLFSPKIISQEFKLGKVTVAELEQKVHPKDSSAVAAILFEKGQNVFDYDQDNGFTMQLEVTAKIKIYKKEGYDWATKKIRYYIAGNGSKEKVLISDATTYNLVNGKIEKTKLKGEAEFDEAINKYWAQKVFTMPNVKEGSIVEFKYIIKNNSIGSPRDWNFQSTIPVNYSEFKMYVPEYFVYNRNFKGYVSPKIIEEKNNRSIQYTYREGRNGVVSGSASQEKLDFIETRTAYIAENLPALKDENYVNNIDNYTVSLSQELSMTKYPNSPFKTFSTDWNSVVKTIYDYDDFGPELNKTGYFEEDLKKLLVDSKTQEEKIWTIFNHVKSNVKWNNYFGYGCDNGVKKAYKEKTGNIADINLMLTAMLRYSGLTANPVLVSTRSNGIALFPNRTAFNYVIAAVETPNGYILLDASEKFSTPNILPLRVLNWSGRLIRKDGTSEEINLMPEKTSSDNVFMTYNIEADGKVTGKTRRQSVDYNAMITRSKISNLKEEEYLEKLENGNNKIEISEYSKTNENDILLPMVETYSFTGNNLCELIGEKIYVSPMLFFTNDKNPFKQELREYPVDFSYPFADKYNITIKIPDGFAVETLPAPAAVSMENNLGAFKFNILANGNILQLSILHQINEAIVSAEKYEMLKEYYKTMIAKETEKIVLKRI
ncbi:DUF3857 domain-containing protein [Flavobacterium sp. IB48]|uniref:DUF3857 domain-containing protein n=1 Tax=Flavobacterium sp. IB48 TaxID=2779375 RepID=UPI0018E79E22|nr:DUF3857 domain-containing protein [Flavobacterium sp. IB48]MBJ2124035.1 DUF3857 domain-containing protein [Flavobacterium sp. IB48]